MQIRRWNPIGNANPDLAGPTFKIVCYNVLAESLEENTTAGVNPHISMFKWRKDRLKNEFDEWNADVYCMQEVEHYPDFWMPFLKSRC